MHILSSSPTHALQRSLLPRPRGAWGGLDLTCLLLVQMEDGQPRGTHARCVQTVASSHLSFLWHRGKKLDCTIVDGHVIVECHALRSLRRFTRVSSWHSVLLTGQRDAGFRACRHSAGRGIVFYWERPGLSGGEVKEAVLKLLRNPFWRLITGFSPMADFDDVRFMSRTQSQRALPYITDFLGACI